MISRTSWRFAAVAMAPGICAPTLSSDACPVSNLSTTTAASCAPITEGVPDVTNHADPFALHYWAALTREPLGSLLLLDRLGLHQRLQRMARLRLAFSFFTFCLINAKRVTSEC